MSSSFSTNFGSRETLSLRTRCGFNPLACPCRITVLGLTPNSAAILRVLQCVVAAGVLYVVSSTSLITSTLTGCSAWQITLDAQQAELDMALVSAGNLPAPNAEPLREVLVHYFLRRQQHDLGAQHQTHAEALCGPPAWSARLPAPCSTRVSPLVSLCQILFQSDA